jgi:hypothetical protein
VLAQVPVPAVYAGVTVRVSPGRTVFASAPKKTSVVPFECGAAAGTAPEWQSLQGSGCERPPLLFTCAWCAPTAAPVVAPFVSVGGAASTWGSAPGTGARPLWP